MKKVIENIELKDKDHLKQWLKDSGRKWLVFNALDLVDSLPFPEGVRLFQTILNYYREYRMDKPTGDFKSVCNPIDGEPCEIEVFHDEMPASEEIDDIIYFLNTQRRQ